MIMDYLTWKLAENREKRRGSPTPRPRVHMRYRRSILQPFQTGFPLIQPLPIRTQYAYGVAIRGVTATECEYGPEPRRFDGLDTGNAEV